MFAILNEGNELVGTFYFASSAQSFIRHCRPDCHYTTPSVKLLRDLAVEMPSVTERAGDGDLVVPKYKIGDTIEWKPDWDDKPHIHTIKFIRIERFAHATTIVYGCHTADKYVDQLVDEPTITATLTRSPT